MAVLAPDLHEASTKLATGEVRSCPKTCSIFLCALCAIVKDVSASKGTNKLAVSGTVEFSGSRLVRVARFSANLDFGRGGG